MAAADVALGPRVSLIGALVAAPLLAALKLPPRACAGVAAVALVAAVLLGLPTDFFGELAHATRALPVLVGGAIGVWLARLREERERAALLLAVQGSVSRILNESLSVGASARTLLREIGAALGWQLGALWEVDADGKWLRRVERWHAPGADVSAFEAASDEIVFEPGRGLPGRVWESGQPATVPSLQRDENFPRGHAAAQSGLESAFAFPIRTGDRVTGVIELFSASPKRPDPADVDVLNALGRQIGQFMERRRAEEERAELLEREHAARVAAERAERRAAETVALLDTLLGRAPVGFAFIDADLRYVRVNDALADANGRSAKELVGRSVLEAVPRPPRVVELLRRVIETGEPAIDVEVSGELPAAPGAERHWLESYYPVRGIRGEVVGVGAVVVEITDRKRAERRSAFLAEATAAFNASLDYEATLAAVAQLAVPELGDMCVVDIANDDGRLVRLAIAHADPRKERLLRDLDRRYPPDLDRQAWSAEVVRTGRPHLHRRVVDASIRAVASDDEQLRALRELGVRSVMVVPIAAHDQVLGALGFASAESGREFGDEDLALAEELGRRAGAAILNARLYRERSEIARTLQASLLPPRLPEIPGLEVAARYRAAGQATDVGGDFYDVFQVAENRWAAVIGDVLGKGAAAAAMIGLVRHTLRAAAMREHEPARILATLNEALYREGAEQSVCTAVYLTINLDGDGVMVDLTSAGHPLPRVVRADGSVDRVGHPGTLVGAVPDLELHPHRVELRRGDALVAFTDGVVEARSDDGIFGEERLERLLAAVSGAPAAAVAERIEREAVAFQADEPRDDLAVLVMRRAGEAWPDPGEATRRLEAAGHSLRAP